MAAKGAIPVEGVHGEGSGRVVCGSDRPGEGSQSGVDDGDGADGGPQVAKGGIIMGISSSILVKTSGHGSVSACIP